MSKVYRIHGARFLRKYTAAEKSSNYAYMADVRKIADTLCKVPWTRVSGDVAATTTIHTEEGLDWNEPERDRFDAAEWCAEHAEGYHRAFAQAACYVFKMPTSAIGKAIEKIRVNVTSDPYNPYGARIAAMTSATLEIPMDCQTVREGEVFRAPDENGMGAAPRLYRTNQDGTQTWYANSEIVELVPGVTLAAKQYLFVFVVLENYNRGRDGWIEGSSYIDNDVELTLSAAASDLVEEELNDLSSVVAPVEYNVARSGKYQSNIGDLSGVLYAEALMNGDDIRALARTQVSYALLGDVAYFDGHLSNLKGAYDANVRFFDQIFSKGGIGSWFQYCYVLSDRQFFGQENYPSSKVINVISIDGNNTMSQIELPLMTDEDIAAGAAFFWFEYPNSSYYIAHLYTKNRVENRAFVSYYNGMWYLSTGRTDGSDRARIENVRIPVCLFGNKPVYFENGVISGEGLPSSINVVGSVTSIRCRTVPVPLSSESSDEMVVSGSLSLVGGVRVMNCAIVKVSSGSVVITKPSFDDLITPNDYKGYAVCPIVPKITDSYGEHQTNEGYFVIGRFTKLSGVDCVGCASVSAAGAVSSRQMSGMDGTIDVVSEMLPYSDDSFFYQGGNIESDMVCPLEAVTRANATTGADRCIGLRSLYAMLQKGELVALPSGIVGMEKPGVGFSVATPSKSVTCIDNGGNVQAVLSNVFRMSLSVIAVPFSLPIGFDARRMRIGWNGWTGSASGGALNVWLMRGRYLEHLDESILKNPGFYIGNGEEVPGCDLIGRVAMGANVGSSVTLDVPDGFGNGLATLLFSAFAPSDGLNPSSASISTFGVAKEFFATDGGVIGSSYLLRPDITLIG